MSYTTRLYTLLLPAQKIRLLLLLVFIPAILAAQGTAEARVQLWREDLQYLKERLPAYDKTFTPITFPNPADSNKRYYAAQKNVLEQFIAGIDSLYKEAHRLSDEEIMIGMCRLIALSPNAHTRLYLFRVRTVMNNVPIGISWFGEDIHIVAAPAAYKSLLGAQVKAINGVATDSVKKRVDELISGNSSWKKYMSLYFLRSPQVMKGLGLSAKADELQLTVMLADKKEKTVMLKADFIPQSTTQEVWKDLSPVTVKQDSLQHLLADKHLPLYLRHTGKNYWYEVMEKDSLVYLQFNRTENSPDISFELFISNMLGAIRTKAFKKFVLDIRFNTGGNNDIAAKGLTQLAASLAGKDVYIITSPSTFSAGITTAAFVKKGTNARIVGEPAGDGLIYLSEGGNVVLPHSKLNAHYANGIHVSYPYKGFTIQPDKVIRVGFDAYKNGKDPVFQYILDQR